MKTAIEQLYGAKLRAAQKCDPRCVNTRVADRHLTGGIDGQ